VNILVLVLVLIMVATLGQYQIKAFGEISTLTPPENIIKVNGTSFTVPYTITGGTVTLIQADTDAKTIDVNVQSSNGGNLTITLPTRLIDAYQGGYESHFVVMNKNHGIRYTAVETSENRTLTIPFSLGNSTIEIKGTYMIPEFGSLTSIILVIAVISAITISKNHSKS
jgi:predicted secreted protein with PEFG-CTERM motif